MFDIGWQELVVVLIVALLIIGPRDLPKAFYTVGKWVRAARKVTSEFQRHVDDMVRETELEDLRKVAKEASSFNVKNQIEKAVDPTGDLKNAFDINAPDTSGSPAASTPAADTSATPGVPTETKPTAVPEPAEPVKPAAKPAAAKAPRKSASKASPRVPSRVPKRAAKPAGGSRKSAAGKASSTEKTS